MRLNNFCYPCCCLAGFLELHAKNLLRYLSACFNRFDGPCIALRLSVSKAVANGGKEVGKKVGAHKLCRVLYSWEI